MKDLTLIAAEYAACKHFYQMYGNQPYLSHLIEVDNLVTSKYAKTSSNSERYSKFPGDEIDMLRAIAFLHDILEDTNATVQELYDLGMPSQVVEAVVLVTKSDDVPYDVYIEKIKGNELARKVKVCDTVANLTNSVREQNHKRIAKYSMQYDLLGGF